MRYEPSPEPLRRGRQGAALAALMLMHLGLPLLQAVAAHGEPTPVRSFRPFDRRSSPGLPQSTVTSLYQDERGVLWIATLDGLASFDGTAVRPVPDVAGAPLRGALHALAARRNGGLYVGGSTALYAFDGSAWTVTEATGGAFSLAQDADGVLWRIDQSGHLWSLSGPLPDLEPGTWVSATLPGDVGPAVEVRATADGSLYVAGRNAVARRQAGTWRLPQGPAPGTVSAFLVTQSGLCWIGTDSGRVFYAAAHDDGWTEVELPGWQGGWIRSLELDRRGRIWAGGNGSQVAFGEPDGPWTVWDDTHGLHPAGRLAIFADREGGLWFAANGHGLQQWIGEAWSHRNLWQTDALPQRRALVFGISGTRDGGFLAAVFNRGVWHWDGREMHQYGEDEGLVRDVRMAVEPEPGVIWVGVRFGIFESRRGGRFRQVLRLPGGFVYNFYQRPGGTWYASTSAAGIYRRTASGWQPAERYNDALPNLNVRGLLWRRSGELWAATMGGIVVFDGDRATRLAPEVGQETQAGVNVLLEVDDEVWSGDFHGIRIWRGGASRRLAPEDGVPGHTVYSLARTADGAVWAGGSAGVGRYAGGRWTRYDIASGLIETECNLNGLWPAPDGSVLVGTMASLARFDSTVEPLERPPLRAYWQDRPVPQADGVAHLAAARRAVRLAWTAPWLGPTPVTYRTRIARLSADWSPPQAESHLTLENLGPGEWQVEVAARLADAAEWSDPIVTRFRIAPHFWETWTFYGLCIVAAVLAGVAAVRWRTRRLARKAHKLELAVREKVAEIKVLGGLLPICACCKKVRDDAGYWRQIEAYVQEHSEAQFSHGLCPDCLVERYPDFAGDVATDKGPRTPRSPESSPRARRG